MIKKNAARGVNSICLAIISRQMKAGDFADPVRTPREKVRRLLLRHLVGIAEHLTRSGKIKLTFRAQLANRGEYIVSAADVGIQSREAVDKAFGDKTLGREVIALVEVVLAEDVKNARVTFQTRGMKDESIDYGVDAAEPGFGRFKRDAPHESMNFITQIE